MKSSEIMALVANFSQGSDFSNGMGYVSKVSREVWLELHPVSTCDDGCDVQMLQFCPSVLSVGWGTGILIQILTGHGHNYMYVTN